MKFKTIAFTLLLAAVMLAGCSGKSTDEGSSLKENAPSDIKEMVHEYSTGKMKAKNASITSQQLIVTDKNGKESAYNLPKDEFFVSIAPYVEQTHPWTNHSLTGCQGELANKEFQVYIEDTEGNVVLDEIVKTQSNGFIDFWLPRDKTYKIKFEYDGKKVESKIATFEGDPTCITTMQLK